MHWVQRCNPLPAIASALTPLCANSSGIHSFVATPTPKPSPSIVWCRPSSKTRWMNQHNDCGRNGWYVPLTVPFPTAHLPHGVVLSAACHMHKFVLTLLTDGPLHFPKPGGFCTKQDAICTNEANMPKLNPSTCVLSLSAITFQDPLTPT